MLERETVMIARATTPSRQLVDRWFYIGVALLMIVFNVAAFAPSIIDPSRRNAPLPLTPLVTAHAVVSAAWLVLFLTQATLVATRHIAAHRRVGGGRYRDRGCVHCARLLHDNRAGSTRFRPERRHWSSNSNSRGRARCRYSVFTLLFSELRNHGRRGIVVSTSPQHPQTPDVACDASGVDSHPYCTSHRSLGNSPAVGGRDRSGQFYPAAVAKRNLRPSVGRAHSSGVGMGSSSVVRLAACVPIRGSPLCYVAPVCGVADSIIGRLLNRSILSGRLSASGGLELYGRSLATRVTGCSWLDCGAVQHHDAAD